MNELEANIEGHTLTIDVAPLLAWESRAWLEPATVLTLVVALAVVAATRAREPGARALAIVPSIAASLCAAVTWLSYDSPVDLAPAGSVLRFVPELAARIDTLGLLPRMACASSIGAAVCVLFDGPSWAARRHAAQLARLVALLVPVGVGAGAHEAASDAHRHLAALDAVTPLPHLALPDGVTLHVGQSREIEPTELTQLAIRAGRAVFFFRPHFGVDDPGSPADAARFDAGDQVRVLMSDDEVRAWGLEHVRVDAPPEPGPFDVEVAVARGPIRVARTFVAHAISDAPDPRFPLVEGSTRRYARSVRVRGGPVQPLPPLELTVNEEVEAGFRIVTVRARVADELVWHERIVPWEGRYRSAPSADAPLAFDLASASAPDASDALGLPCGFTSASSPLARCECTATEPFGPRRCTNVDRHTGEVLLSAGLAALTLGVTLFAGVTPPDATITELRLESVDDAPLDTPSALEAGRSRPRVRAAASR